QLKGMTGNQGVIIPEQNVRNLMLRPEVLQAVEQGQFSIYAVSHAYQALELLLSRAMGEMNQKGKYPTDSIMALVLAQLKHWHDIEKGDKPKKKKVKKAKKMKEANLPNGG
ncbi:MAG TPA: ATP-dependent protease, partial [Agitococcus sp.]|nr:ATP-dependent protease [Agitococcus sp.]